MSDRKKKYNCEFCGNKADRRLVRSWQWICRDCYMTDAYIEKERDYDEIFEEEEA